MTQDTESPDDARAELENEAEADDATKAAIEAAFETESPDDARAELGEGGEPDEAAIEAAFKELEGEESQASQISELQSEVLDLKDELETADEAQKVAEETILALRAELRMANENVKTLTQRVRFLEAQTEASSSERQPSQRIGRPYTPHHCTNCQRGYSEREFEALKREKQISYTASGTKVEKHLARCECGGAAL